VARRRRHRPEPGAQPPGADADVRAALAEDQWRRDVSTELWLGTRAEAAVPARGTVYAQSRAIVSGVAVAQRMARVAGLRLRSHVRDGDTVLRGRRVLELEGDARRILGVERTLLNYLMHLSGVATETARAVAAARRGRRDFRVRATRKTLPGLRDLEKDAVVHGGGEPHRRDLSDAVLIKSNHLALVPLRDGLLRLSRRRDRARFQIEVRSGDEAEQAVRAGLRRLLVDNRTPTEVRSIVRRVRALPGGSATEVEVSGGISPRNVARYARSGAQAASLGSLTHSAPAAPFHLVLEPGPRGSRPRRRVDPASRAA
jgi:nicotinate-nucleotide pyrophosphorylase (carboxylating)